MTQRFIEGANKTIKDRANFPEKIVMCFAIMEIESWFLAMCGLFERLDKRLTTEFIKEQTGIDLTSVDPEKEFFHPANEMQVIYQLADMTYDKHKGDIEALANCLSKDDYANLFVSDKCHQFKLFCFALNVNYAT